MLWVTTSTARIRVSESLTVAQVRTEIFSLLWNLKTYYCPHVSSLLGPDQSQMSPRHTLLPYLFQIRLTLYSHRMWEDNIKIHFCAIGWCLSKRQCEGSSDVDWWTSWANISSSERTMHRRYCYDFRLWRFVCMPVSLKCVLEQTFSHHRDFGRHKEGETAPPPAPANVTLTDKNQNTQWADIICLLRKSSVNEIYGSRSCCAEHC